MAALARITRGGCSSPHASAEEGGKGEPKPCPRCASHPCRCPPQAPLAADEDDGRVIPKWRAAERWVPAYRPDLAWVLAPLPQRPVYTATGGGPRGPITLSTPPTVWVNTMAEDGTWRRVEVPRCMLLTAEGALGAPKPAEGEEQALPVFEAPAHSPSSIESVCSSTGRKSDELADSGDSSSHLDLDLKL